MLPFRSKAARAFCLILRVLRIALCAGLIQAANTYAADEAGVAVDLAVESHPFHFEDGGEAPSYSLRLGNSPTPDAVIFFVSGSGCPSVKHRLSSFFAPLAGAINATVLVLQKRGIDEDDRSGRSCSAAFYQNDYLGQTIADQREFIDAQLPLLPARPRAVVLIGASEGAVVAAKIAAADPRVTHLGLIGGGGATVRENLRILSPRTWYLRNLDSSFADIEASPWDTNAKVWGHSYKYWASILDVNLGDELLRLNIPIVEAMGENDEAVPIEPALALRRRFEEAGKTNFHLLLFPHANHRLEDPSTGASHAQDFLAALVQSVDSGTASTPSLKEDAADPSTEVPSMEGKGSE